METAWITKSFRKEDVSPDWWVVDAAGKTVGRLASQVAAIIRGKHKPWFTPHVDTGDFVIILNADKVELKGKRIEQKEYFRHSQYPGRGKFTSFKEYMEKHPEKIMEMAVNGMLPKNRLGRKMKTKLKVYTGTEHPHGAQQPKTLEIK
ncbi:50S ribosomal protein L13 [Candidatus Kapabacteria bacterium]|nr:50S ribosomal protein L13 [Candidatus Kapabacteria bacterium]